MKKNSWLDHCIQSQRTKKLFNIMRISFVLLFVLILHISASINSQSVKLNFSVTNLKVKDVLKLIEGQSNYRFFYNYDLDFLDKELTLSSHGDDVNTILDNIFRNSTITYKLLENNVVIIAPQVNFQQRRVSGHITDSNGEPMIGVNITIKGTNIGVICDNEGKYSIEIPSGAVTLVFSYIGYLTEERAVESESTVDVVLSEDITKLDEVVVIGYGSLKKSDLTGAVMSANIKDFEKSPNTNLVQSLQGTVPGLNIGQVTTAGATPDISIRGKNTINGNTGILIVLDGIIYGNSLSSINPADIESVDILKDASASAVYGAQAANGVMLITSKKGKAGKARVSFSSSYSIQNPTHNYSTMNRAQYLEFLKNLMWNKAYTQASGYLEEDPSFDVADWLPETDYMLDDEGNIATTDFDWWGTCTRQTSILENNLTVSGGNDALSYLVSLGNVDQKNFLLNDNFKRNSVRVNLDANVRPWWKMGIQTSGSFVNQDGSEPSLWELYSMNPLASAYNADGSINPSPMIMARSNPLRGSNVTDKERHNYFIGNIYSEFKLPVKGLTYRINFGNNYTINTHYQSNPYGNSLTGEAYKEFSENYNYTLDNIVNYSREFNLHSVNVTLVYGARENEYSYTKADATAFTRLTLGYNALELGTNQFAFSDANDNASLYQMARLNYKFNNRYLITATVRRDGFSGFAANHKSAVFPSVALGWVISDENFFKKVPVINYLKLRGGYGVSGNLPYDKTTYSTSYTSLARVTSGAGYIFGDGASAVNRQELTSMENKDLKWERTNGFNIGLDFRFLNDRIQGSAEAYKTTTHDLLFDVAIPTITGFSSIKSNVGELQNKGIELTITSHNIVSRNFEWSTTFNLSSNSNKIIKLTTSDDVIGSCLFIGESLSAIYDYKIDGIYQVGDVIPTDYYLGNYKIHDVSGDGSITTADRTIVGKTDPAYRFSIMNKLTYKDFSLSFFINSIQGGKDGYLGENTYSLIQDNTGRGCNHLNEFTKYIWSPRNSDGIYSASTSSGKITPIRYEDRSFIRLQDVTFGYNLPKKSLTRLGIENVNLFVTGKNMVTITKWHGWDPEANSGTITPAWKTSSMNKSGDDFEGRPVMRSFTFGIDVTF
jgi:TonB-dependent starch-binding outer membrane protein SusC